MRYNNFLPLCINIFLSPSNTKTKLFITLTCSHIFHSQQQNGPTPTVHLSIWHLYVTVTWGWNKIEYFHSHYRPISIWIISWLISYVSFSFCWMSFAILKNVFKSTAIICFTDKMAYDIYFMNPSSKQNQKLQHFIRS